MNCPPLFYTADESTAANKAWKATCGPHSIAAACGVNLDAVKHAMDLADVNYRGWMSPTQVTRTLHALNRKFDLRSGLKTMMLCQGINRVQWEGPWLKPGVPARVAYFQTHLVAFSHGWVLCTACETAKWIRAEEWREFHLYSPPESPFHITHHWTLENGY